MLAVTTALCADQVAVAAPALRPQVAELAGRIVTKLAHSFRQTVTAELPVHSRQRVTLVRPGVASRDTGARHVAHRAVSPFQFRLPPPTL